MQGVLSSYDKNFIDNLGFHASEECQQILNQMIDWVGMGTGEMCRIRTQILILKFQLVLNNAGGTSTTSG